MRALLLSLALVSAGAIPALALTPSQLTPQERGVYDGLKSDSTAARRYLDTRGFVKDCQRVVAHRMKAIDLPVQPDGYDPQYVTGAEQQTVDRAIDLNVAALISSPTSA